ncbi:unnamed protein product [Brassicogethes aeneus]|uniref:Uncharacterized protein n=1 Tax=Brassicogethes aeneus TaxID=1431903 RepID=A0A9P0B857_BRAAE|nr:unnamed protein product [Brassicogethes aeneus]
MKIFGALAIMAFLSTVKAENLEEAPTLEGNTSGVSKFDPIALAVNVTINKMVSKLPEPINLSTLSYAIDNKFIKGNVSVESISIAGLKKLIATAIKVKVIPINADLTFSLPSLNLVATNYNIDLTILNKIPLSFKGNMGFSVDALEFLVIADVFLNKTIHDLQICMNMNDFKFDITGLYNEALSNFVSKTLTETIAPFANEYAALITEVISPILKSIINSNTKTILVNFEGTDILNTEYDV